MGCGRRLQFHSSSQDRCGGSVNPSRKNAIDFQRKMEDCDLIDAGFQGLVFTWHRGSLMERLDCILINLDWCIRFKNALVLHLPFFKSNHRAVLIKFIELTGTNKNRRLLRFIVVWLTHAQFDPFIKEFWCKELNWDDRLRDFRVELRRWNKEVFGNIFAWKCKLIR